MNWKRKIPSVFVKDRKLEHNYRVFKNLYNIDPPFSIYKNKKVINWSNNDYNGISQNPHIKRSLIFGINNLGCGSSGTRNIGGSNAVHTQLESKVANLHCKEKGLIFNSGYHANLSCMEALGTLFPDAKIFSDEYNHNSIINGIKLSGLEKHIFKHNDMNNLELFLKKVDSPKKIIAVESLYSIDGSIAPFKDLLYLSKKYNALTFVDEIHAVGVHGEKGGGITEMLNIQDEIDIIMGGFGKGYGLLGGYLSGCKDLIDSIRLCGTGFIFTTSLPPHIVLGIMKSMDYNIENIKENQEKRNRVIKYFKEVALEKNIPLIKNNFDKSQIQSIYIGCPLKSKKIHNSLLEEKHYVQHLNYPTVFKGSERLRLSLKSFHNKKMINDLLTKIDILLKNL